MARFALALAIGALALAPATAQAQAAKKPAAPVATPNKAQLERAAANLRVYVSALQSDKIPEAVKTVLFLCVYSNPFKEISEGTDKALAAKKASNTDPNMVVGAMAAVCGFKPGQIPAPAPKK
jgi:hypothetical protein